MAVSKGRESEIQGRRGRRENGYCLDFRSDALGLYVDGKWDTRDNRPVRFGYIRVSTVQQNEALQVDALRRVGVDRVYVDKISGVTQSRPEFDKMCAALRPGDHIIVYSLSRLGRNTIHLLQTIGQWKEQGVSFESLTEHLNTQGSMGTLVLTIFAALAQFERELLHERQTAGIEAAKARGQKFGRPKAVTNPKKLDKLQALRDEGYSFRQIQVLTGIHRATAHRYLSKLPADPAFAEAQTTLRDMLAKRVG